MDQLSRETEALRLIVTPQLFGALALDNKGLPDSVLTKYALALRYFRHDTMGCFTSPMQLSRSVKQSNFSALRAKSGYNIV